MSFDKSKWSKHKKAMQKGWKSHASATRKSGFDMPYPIKNGVAKLKEINFVGREDDDGEEYDICEIVGVIQVPSEHKGKEVRCAHFLKEGTYNTLEEAYDNLLCDFRTIGMDVSDPDEVDGEIAKALKNHAAFKFSTKKGKKNPYCVIEGPHKAEKEAEDPAPTKEAKDEEKPWTDEEDPFA